MSRIVKLVRRPEGSSPGADSRREEIRAHLTRIRTRPSFRHDIAVAASYFNPCGYASRRRNFDRFRECLNSAGVEAVVAEWHPPSRARELADVPCSKAVEAGDALWQKERLINLACMELAERGYEKIAWVDADVVWPDDDWPRRISATLDHFPICQAFERVERERARGARERFPSAGARYVEANNPWAIWRGEPGFAWAARTSVLEAAPLYEHAIVGGADQMILAACFCSPETPDWEGLAAASHGIRDMTPAQLWHYAAWARRFGGIVRGQLGCAKGSIQAGYHGELRRRFYAARHEILRRHDFDPATDVAAAPGEGLRWNSEKPGLHRELLDYFASRREDG